MSTVHDSEPWTVFWASLIERIGAIDLGGLSAGKFDDLTRWLGNRWCLEPGAVVCKYIQHSKNRWNRLREAARRAPNAILLLSEDEDLGDLNGKVEETANVCPSLQFVVVLVRHEHNSWALRAILYRESTALPPLLTNGGASVSPVPFSPRTSTSPSPNDPLPVFVEDAGPRLLKVLQSLGATGDDSASLRAAGADALAELTGQPISHFVFKTIPSTKNLGNRLGEALTRSPSVLVVICPEMLCDRVLEEAQRWDSAGVVPIVLVLCGDQVSFRVDGPDEELARRLRIALGIVTDHADSTKFASDGRVCGVRASADWRTWPYETWNANLVEYCLLGRGTDLDPVERLAATPEELVELVGATLEEAEEVSKAFVDACLANIPSGRSFYGFCGSKLGRKRASDPPWTPEALDPPYFFAMLWFTCLVAYGYPGTEGGFYERIWSLMGNTDYLRRLPDLWWELAEWTLRRSEAGDAVRVLNLPPKDDFYTVIGESHFLAFPHKHDRRQLARVLVEADLVGFEPPILPVVSHLQAERGKFSGLFREDMDNFVSKFVAGGRDPRDSAFWRAVRQEALQPSSLSRSHRSRRALTSLLGVFNDEGFLPLLGCSQDWSPPPGYCIRPLDNPIGEFEFYAAAERECVQSIHEIIFESVGLLGPGPRALVNQGVLVFQEDQSNEYFLVSGHEISGADFALVRDDVLDAFTAVFGGRTEPSRLPGWTQVEGCSVKPLDAAPAGLETVVHLQRTMSPPTVRFVGGIRVPGGYLGVEGFLPRLRAPEADSVVVEVDGHELACEPMEGGDWSLPPRLIEFLPVGCHVVGSWKYPSGNRTGRRRLQLERAAIDDRFRSLGSGHFFIESCRPGQKSIGGGATIPLGVTTEDGAGTIDLIDYEPSARFMGPGQGELSRDPQSRFDWLAVGHKNHPELLVFVGNPELPAQPANMRSSAPGDRRHWNAAFAKPSEIRVRSADGIYHEIADFPAVLASRGKMLHHRPTADAPTCPETLLDTKDLAPPHRSSPLDETRLIADALAGLSVRRSGLRHRTVQQLFEELTRVHDFGLHNELIRAWTEAGALDLVRSQSYSSTLLVPRRPRLIAVRRGPVIEASLIGLVTRAREAQVRRLATERGVVLHELQPGCPWQPIVLRLRATERAMDEIIQGAGLGPLEWLAWSRDVEVPESVLVDPEDQGLWTDDPPKGFVLAKVWDWGLAEFRRDTPASNVGVQLEQRVKRDSCSIYVVLVDGEPRLWTHMRNWALLYAHVKAGLPPFSLNSSGWITATGRSPVHLPLSLGRMCAVLGEGLAGPLLDSNTRSVVGYCYPFGRRLTRLMAKVLPPDWLKGEEA